MVNELSDSREIGRKGHPPIMPSRELTWNEANEASKCERLRDHVKKVEKINRKLLYKITQLENHMHGPDGRVLISLQVSNEMEDYPTDSLRNNRLEELLPF